MKKTFLFLTILMLSNALYAQYKQVEEISKLKSEFQFKPDEGLASYTKFELVNGLVVIINEDHSDPLITVNLTYRFGSGNDMSDRTGISYLAYLLMQSGTKHFPRGSYESLLKEYGGTFNANITRDYTCFVSVIPKNLFETSLRMESDRMACMIDSLTEEKFLRVRNELNDYVQEKTFSDSYGLVENQMLSSLYMYGYPYSWPVYGMSEHSQNILINDFIKYFLDWYGPNNAIITICGDVKTESAISLVNRYFGKIPKATNTKPLVNPYSENSSAMVPGSIPENHYVSYTYDVKKPMLRIVFPTVPKFDFQEPMLDIFADLLGKDTSSFLTRRLIHENLAESVKVIHRTSMLAGEFIIDIVAPTDTPLYKVKNRTIALIDSFYNLLDASPDYNEPVMNRQIFKYRQNYNRSFEKTEGVAENLSISQLYFGDPNFATKFYYQMNVPSLVKMMRVDIQNFIKSKPALYVSSLPEGKTYLAADKDNYRPMVLNTILTHVEKSELKLRTMPSYFNKKAPKIRKIKNLELPTYTLQKFENGLKFITVPNKEHNYATLKIYINLDNYSSNKYRYPVPVIFTELLKDKVRNFHDGELIHITQDAGNNLLIYPYENNTVLEICAPGEEIFMFKEAIIQFFRETGIADLNHLNRILPLLSRKLDFIENPDFYSLNAFRNLNAKMPDDGTIYPEVESILKNNINEVSGLIPEILSPRNMTIVISGNFEEAFTNDFIEQFKHIPNLNDNKVYVLKNTFGSDGNIAPEKPAGVINLYILDNTEVKDPVILLNYMNLNLPRGENFFSLEYKKFALMKILDQKVFPSLAETPGNYICFKDQFYTEDTVTFYLLNANVPQNLADTSFRIVLGTTLKINQVSLNKKAVKLLRNSYMYNQILLSEGLSEKADIVYQAVTNDQEKNYYQAKERTVKMISYRTLNSLLKENFRENNMKILVICNKKISGEKLEKLTNFNGIPIRVFKTDRFGNILH